MPHAGGHGPRVGDLDDRSGDLPSAPRAAARQRACGPANPDPPQARAGRRERAGTRQHARRQRVGEALDRCVERVRKGELRVGLSTTARVRASARARRRACARGRSKQRLSDPTPKVVSREICRRRAQRRGRVRSAPTGGWPSGRPSSSHPGGRRSAATTRRAAPSRAAAASPPPERHRHRRVARTTRSAEVAVLAGPLPEQADRAPTIAAATRTSSSAVCDCQGQRPVPRPQARGRAAECRSGGIGARRERPQRQSRVGGRELDPEAPGGVNAPPARYSSSRWTRRFHRRARRPRACAGRARRTAAGASSSGVESCAALPAATNGPVEPAASAAGPDTATASNPGSGRPTERRPLAPETTLAASTSSSSAEPRVVACAAAETARASTSRPRGQAAPTMRVVLGLDDHSLRPSERWP
jgi:hypothetical protein